MRIARVAVLALAVAAGGGAYYFSQTAKQPVETVASPAAPAPAPVQTEDVLVAAHDLPLGKMIAQGDLAWQAWPKDALTPGLIKKSENEKALTDMNGAIVRASLLGGEPVRRERLVKGPNAGFLSAVLPSGKRAVAINIDSQGATSAGGFILPNDHVDVIRTVKPDNGSGDVQSETLLRNVKVLAIGQNIEDKNGQPVVVGSNATLELDPAQAETIILAQRTGQLSLVLRSMLDASADTAAPTKQDDQHTTIVRYGVASDSAPH
jgi:pilus assembly protein CpaB